MIFRCLYSSLTLEGFDIEYHQCSHLHSPFLHSLDLKRLYELTDMDNTMSITMMMVLFFDDEVVNFQTSIDPERRPTA